MGTLFSDMQLHSLSSHTCDTRAFKTSNSFLERLKKPCSYSTSSMSEATTANKQIKQSWCFGTRNTFARSFSGADNILPKINLYNFKRYYGTLHILKELKRDDDYMFLNWMFSLVSTLSRLASGEIILYDICSHILWQNCQCYFLTNWSSFIYLGIKSK